MPAFWVFAIFYFAMAALITVKAVKAKSGRPMWLAAALLFLVAAVVHGSLAGWRSVRPQLDLVNVGKEPLLWSTAGIEDAEKLVPSQETSRRYGIGDSLTVWRVSPDAPGESRSFTLPEAENRQSVLAEVRADIGGDISVDFRPSPPR
jgi:hypothetical protein